MQKINIIIFFVVCSLFSCTAQDSIDSYLGDWSGEMTEKDPFLFTIELKRQSNDDYILSMIGKDQTTTLPLKRVGKYLMGEFEDQLKIHLEFTDSQIPLAFIQTGHHLSYLDFKTKKEGLWIAKWNLLISEKGSATFCVSMNQEDGNYFVYPYFKAPSFHYMYGQDLVYRDKTINFRDIRSGIKFKGTLNDKKISLTCTFLKESTQIQLSPKPHDDWNLGYSNLKKTDQQLIVKDNPLFKKLANDIQNDHLERTHSVVIAQNDEIIFEQYFDGFTANTPHDTRSLSKTFAGTMIGIAISKDLIESEKSLIKPFFIKKYPEIDWSKDKDKINLYHLMTMSSGLDAIDFGLNRMSFANEGTYQNQEDWTKHILSAPMVKKVGEEANYGSGSPHLLGPIIAGQLDERLEFFIHKNLYGPLGITNYRIQTNNYSQPYFGGGWYFTPRDLIRFGQLYLNQGQWNGKQLIPKGWIEKSMQRHTFLANASDKNPYGFLVWHKTYNVGGKKISSVEGRGAGGQYLFMIPDLDLVAVITSGNYRNNKGFQPEKIMKEYILRSLIKH